MFTRNALQVENASDVVQMCKMVVKKCEKKFFKLIRALFSMSVLSNTSCYINESEGRGGGGGWWEGSHLIFGVTAVTHLINESETILAFFWGERERERKTASTRETFSPVTQNDKKNLNFLRKKKCRNISKIAIWNLQTLKLKTKGQHTDIH